MDLDVKELVAAFDTPTINGRGILSRALGEEVLLALLCHALTSDSDSGRHWTRTTKPRPVVCDPNGRSPHLDATLSDGNSFFLVECKCLTASSTDHVALCKLAGIGTNDLTTATNDQLWAYSQAAWHEGHEDWNRNLVDYQVYLRDWHKSSKVLMPTSENVTVSENAVTRCWACWRPVVTPPAGTGNPRQLPPYFSDMPLSIEKTHLRNQPRVFSGSLYARHLSANKVERVSMVGDPVEPLRIVLSQIERIFPDHKS
ncbi:MAG TPA: hypothetical protein VHC43_03330 [Mycobacteriales bacterium]|nr:hypothetical protein [Mycobacteriales bacterium]